jgi:hypothetical protein
MACTRDTVAKYVLEGKSTLNFWSVLEYNEFLVLLYT